MEEYELDLDIFVPVKNKKIIAENEDEAMGKVFEEYEKKGISKERISNVTWKLVKKTEPSVNAVPTKTTN